MFENKCLVLPTQNDKSSMTPVLMNTEQSEEKSRGYQIPGVRLISKSLDYIHAPVKSFFDNLRDISREQKDTSEQVLNTIDRAVSIMEKELEKELDPQERQDVRDKVCNLVTEARKEASESRLFAEGLALLGGSIALVAVGFGIMAIETRAASNKQEPLLLEKS
ncbi:MAG TPA: hypothetical protein VJL89_10705 [Thermodesulfovibrionia bacterium]|nr:hypothetical protein [Thermodesulfovibrionia bacterium]